MNLKLKTCIKFISFLILKFSTQVLAQQAMNNLDYELERMVQIPNNPDVSYFMRYGDTSADLYSGTVDVSIPLYTIQGSELDIPIGLTYDTSGIRVDQEASIIGLGWNLKVGGRISRIVNGLADETINGNGTYLTINHKITRDKILYYSQNLNQNTHPSISSAQQYLDFMHDISINNIDAQPDFYSLFAPGINDHFIPDINESDNRNKAINNPRTKIMKNNNGGHITWQVISDNGTTYFFEESERYMNHNEVTSSNSSANAIVEFENSWVLTKIISSNKKDVFEFEYYSFDYYQDHVDYNSRIQKIQKHQRGSPYIIYDGTSAIANWATKKVLYRIKHNGHVTLTTNFQNRFDVGAKRSNTRLTNIQITSPQGRIITQFQFDNNDYFNLDDDIPENKNFRDIRLKLNSISQLDSTETSFKIHRFNYIQPNDVPSRTSYAKDYFGYYNGRDSNTHQLEACKVGDIHFNGSNRKPSTGNHASFGLLEKIIYPTGGKTVFDYEKHDHHRSILKVREVNFISKTINRNSIPTITYACDDEFIDYQNPIIDSVKFTLSEETIFKIYYQGKKKDSKGFIISGSLNNYCDLNSSIVKWGNLSNFNQNKITLPAGTYSIVLLLDEDTNNQYGSTSLYLTKEITEIINENEVVGGVRIAEITDYSTNTIIAKKRRFEYKDDEGKSTGRQNHIANLTINKQFTDDDGVPITVTTRRASFSRPNIPMVTYDLVKEFIIDNNGNSKGYTVNEFYIGSKGIVPNTNEPYGNNLIPSLTAGQLKKQTIRDSDNKDVLTKIYEYAQHSGVLMKGLSTYVDDTKQYSCYQYNYCAEEINEGTPNYYVQLYMGKTSYKGEGRCDLNISPIQGQTLSILPKHDHVFSNSFIGNMGITSSGTVYGGLSKITSKRFFYDESGNVSELTNLSETVYDSTVDYLPKKNTVTNSDGRKIETAYFYPKSLSTGTSSALINQNKLATILKSQITIKDKYEKILSSQSQNTIYDDWGSGLILPKAIQSLKGAKTKVNYPEDRFIFDRYDTYGNVLESHAAGDPAHTITLWGYNGQYPIARIENATYDEVQTALGLSADQEPNENNLKALDALRSSKTQWMITTYRHEPLIGVTQITQPNGISTYYEYDDFNRLETIKDIDGNTIESYEYHYKNE